MTDIILGAKIQIDTGGSTQAMSSTVKGMADMGKAAKQAQSQFAALSKQAQASFTSINAALGMNRASEIAKAALDANKAMGMLGASALSTNKAVAASLGSSSNIMAAMTGSLKAVSAESDKAVKAVDKVGKASEKAGLSFRGWLPHIRTAGASIGIYLGVRMVKSIGDAADAYTNMSARLKLVATDANQLANVQSRLYQISQTNQSGLEETTKLYTRMAMGLKDLGRSQSDILNVTDLLGKGMKISGASTVEAAAGLLQFSQAMQSGILSGDEFRSLMENMPRVSKAIADGLGVSLGQLRKMSAAQELTSAKAIKALMSQSEALNGEAARIPVTLGRAWTELGNAFTKLIGDADQLLGVTQKVAAGIEGLAKVVEKFANTKSPLAQTREEIRALAEEIQNLRNPGMFTFFADDRLKTAQEQMLLLETRKNRLEREARTETGGNSRQAQDYIDAAKAAWKLTEAQKAVVEQIVKTAEAEGFDPAFLLSIAKAESSFNALSKAATTSASGAFQLINSTAKRFGVKDPFNVEQAAVGAGKYLTVLQRQFKDTHLAAQAYHDGEGAVARAGNRVPSDSTDSGYGTRILKNMEKLQKAMGNATSDIGKDIAKAEKDQFDVYSENLTRREKAYDDYSKVALAKNKTLMDQLQAQQQAASVSAEQASKMGDTGALAQAEEDMRRLIIARNQATQDSIALEEKAANKRLGNIGMEIAAAKKLGQANEVAKLQAERLSTRADLGALEETRKQLTIQTNEDLLANARQFAEKRLQIEQQLTDARTSLSQEQFQATLDDQKALIDTTLDQAKTQFAVNEQQRQEALEGATGLEAIAQRRENINAKLRDTLALIQAEKQAALDKLTIDSQTLDYQEQIATSQRDNAASMADRIKAETDLAKVHEQQAKNAQAYLDVLNGVTAQEAKARAEAAKQGQKMDAQSVKEEQLRMNAYWDQTISRMKDAQKIWVELLGSQADGFGDIALSLVEFSKQLDQIGTKYDALAEKGKEADEAGQTRFGETAKAVAQSIAATAVGMRKMFEEGSNGYKAMTALAGAAALAQDAINIADGIGAILKQLKDGDVYTAIPRAIAVAGMVAQLIGHAVGTIAALGGGSRTVKAEDRQKTQGTGTVFGDAAAQSNSIANSLEVIKQNSSNDLNYSAAMLRSLEDLSNSILALANQVTSIVMPSIDAAIQASGMQFGKQNISLFSGFNKQLTDSGIGWYEASLSRILSGDFTAKMYADITRSFEVMGSAISESTQTYVRDAGSEVSNQIVMIFRGIVTAFQEGVKAFGLTTDSVLTALKGFKVGMEQISLKDMTMEEQTAALNAVFSKITDQMTGVLNRKLGLALGPFRKAGEGMAETFFRVSEGITRAKNEMEQFGLTAVDYKTLSAGAKQGDVAAEIVRKTIATQMVLADGVKAYVNELQGSAEDIIDATKKLIHASNLLKTAGIGDTNLNRDMINAAGGLDAFNSAMEAFNQNFLSQGQNMAGEFRSLSEQFAHLGYTIPSTREGFRDLIVGFNVTDAASAKLFGQLVALSDGMAKVFDETERLTQKYASMLDPMANIRQQIETVKSDFDTLIGAAIAPIAGKATEGRNQANSAIGSIQQMADERAKEITRLNASIATWDAKLKKELAKKPKNQNKALIKRLEEWIAAANDSVAELNGFQALASEQIQALRDEIIRIDTSEIIDKAAAKAPLLLQARDAMAQTLEEIFNGLAQSIQAAQQRLQSVLNLQKSLASQLATLQGPGAIFNLASGNLSGAWSDINNYIAGVQGGGARNVDTEVNLIQTAQQAVMDKYNAEISAIQEAEREFIAAETERLNAALQAQIDAINAALDAQIKAQSKLDAAAQKAMQKQFDAEQKALQKAHDAQLKALGDELDAANKLADAIKNINEYVRGMALGGNSPLSPEAKLAEAQRQYQDLLARAQGGDADAMQRLTGASDAYLEASKAYYGSGTQYANTFGAVKNAMSAIGGMSAPDPDSIQSRIDALREAQAEEMDALRELQSEKLDALREKQQEAIDAMREAAQKQIEAAQKATQQAIADLSDPNKNAAMKAARESAERDLAELARLAELTRKEAERQAQDAKDAAAKQAEDAWKLANDQLTKLGLIEGLNNDQLSALNRILENAGIQPVPVTARAKGGYTPAGMTLVGEQGPELVRFTKPGQVYNATDTQSMLGDNEKVVAAIAELKAEMRAVVVTQSNANPQIIEKLAGMESRLSKMERTQRFTVGA